MRRLIGWLVLAFAWSASVAAAETRLRPELPSAEQPVRRVAVTGYTLALSWTPEYCHGARGQRADDPECGTRARRGYTLHGLWPDGDGPNRWPQYCHPVELLTDTQIAAGQGATPSPQLLQHEWAKHGSCMATNPVRYFREETAFYRAVKTPDMAALAARRGLRARDVQQAFADANPGMRPDMLRVSANRRGWLEEIWLCLGLDKRPRTCPAGQGGAAADLPIRVQRPN